VFFYNKKINKKFFIHNFNHKLGSFVHCQKDPFLSPLFYLEMLAEIFFFTASPWRNPISKKIFPFDFSTLGASTAIFS
jgi:hypothetical protein